MDFLISYILFIVHPSPNANIAPNVAVYPDEAYIPRPPNTGLGPPPSDTRVH